MDLKPISTNKSPTAIGPYSQAIQTENLIFTSGQLPLNINGEFAGNDIKTQTQQSLHNVKNILEAVGSNMNNVIKTTVYLADMNDFAQMNEVYKEFFSEPFPARSCFQVARLPKDALVEIEVIAHL